MVRGIGIATGSTGIGATVPPGIVGRAVFGLAVSRLATRADDISNGEHNDPEGATDAAAVPEFASLADHFAFYPAKLDCTVDDETVVAQPGDYYGGWVTAEIVGPFKTGDEATAWW